MTEVDIYVSQGFSFYYLLFSDLEKSPVTSGVLPCARVGASLCAALYRLLG